MSGAAMGFASLYASCGLRLPTTNSNVRIVNESDGKKSLERTLRSRGNATPREDVLVDY